MPAPLVTVSVVSHAQNSLVNQLLQDLAQRCAGKLTIIVTENVADPVPLRIPAGQAVEQIANRTAKGFGANHNAAFRRSTSPVFVILNPDIRLEQDPFPSLSARLRDEQVAAAGPLVRSPQGASEDSARKFPTLFSLVKKVFSPSAGPDYSADSGAVDVDWIAGMCIAFRRDAFENVGGFDERYFLYYEDVDICRRLRSHGYKIVYDTTVSVVHEARRASRRNPRLMRIHAASALRYLLSSYKDGS